MSQVDDIIALLDRRMEGGVSRLTFSVSDEFEREEIKEQYHHGRCDVGSPWAKGTVPNCDSVDIDEIE